MAKRVSKSEQKFNVLYSTYIRLCEQNRVNPLEFYYEKGFVKSPSLKKSKRVSSFEEMVRNLESEIYRVREEIAKEQEIDNVEEGSSEVEFPQDTEVPEASPKKWYDKFIFWR